jgi:GT2 family glycosyltransferase
MMSASEALLDRRVVGIVLNWHDEPSTVMCLESLVDAGLRRFYVIDNESSGQLRAAIAAAARLAVSSIELLELPENRGFAGGVNVALSLFAKSDFEAALVINNDAEWKSGDINLLLRRLVEPQTIAVAPFVENAEGEVISSGGVVGLRTMSVDDTAFPREPEFLTWACVLLSRAAVQSVGLLDERFFMYWEDVDWSFRARAAGYKVVVDSETRVTHRISSSHGRAGDRILMYSAAGLALFARKLGRRAYVGARVRVLSRLGRQIAAGNASGARAILRGWRFGRTVEESAYRTIHRLR